MGESHQNRGIKMQVFWTEISGLDEARARYPGRSRARGSAFGVSLLAWAVERVWGIALPEIAAQAGGKPYFPACPELHFSISHTKTAVLAALSAHPVGADVEQRRAVRRTTERILTEAPCGDLDLFELWTLRESYFKLTGRGSLRTIPFSRENGVLLPPEAGVLCRLYDEVPGCAAAVCSMEAPPPERLEFVDAARICT